MMGYWNDHMDGGHWVWMIAMSIFWLAAIGAITWTIVTAILRRDGSGGSAVDELDRRLARGDIDVDEYRRRRDAMRSKLA